VENISECGIKEEKRDLPVQKQKISKEVDYHE